MPVRLSRFAPLTGVIFAAVLVAGVLVSGETPDGNASSATVIAYYGTHRSDIEASAVVFVFAFSFLVLFAAALRSYLRRTAAADGLSG